MRNDHKYYVIIRGINGKLYRVEGVDKKKDVWDYVREYLSLGYQLTAVTRAVMLTATNLFEAREKIGFPHPNF
jgi:hypothetical protein